MSRPVDRAYRAFVSYIDKSREYYAAHGYDRPYQWAYHDTVPFTPLAKPLAESRVGLLTTAALLEQDRPAEWGDSKTKRPFALELDRVPMEMFTEDLAWDRGATHLDDRETYIPIEGLRAMEKEGRIGSVGHRLFGVPTEYSQRRTNEVDAPAIVEWARQDDIDVMLLVPL